MCGMCQARVSRVLRRAVEQDRQGKVGVGVVFKPTDKVRDARLCGLFLKADQRGSMEADTVA